MNIDFHSGLFIEVAYHNMSVGSWPILLKNSEIIAACISAENQNFLNSTYYVACKLASSSLDRDR